MDVIVLAGGFGKRLQSVVRNVPKPMADIEGRPFLAYLLDSFAAQGATRALLSVGYLQESIVRYFGDRHQNMDIEYIREDEPLGTGGAIRKALLHSGEATVVAANGDTFLELELPSLLRFHAARRADVTMAVRWMDHSDRYGTVLTNGDRAVGFLEKAPRRSGYINGGTYALDRVRILEMMKNLQEPFSFETDFLQKCVEKIKAFVYAVDGYFIDIGIPEDYDRARKELPRSAQPGTNA